MSLHGQHAAHQGHDCHDGHINGSASLQLGDDDLCEWEKQESEAHVDLAAYDHATLVTTAALSGNDGSARTLSELPLLPVAPWNRSPGYVAHLTPEQEQKLDKMRASFPEAANWHNDHDFLRFLRAKSFNLEAACKMYSKYCHVYRGRLLISPAPVVRHTSGGWPLHLVDLFPARPEKVTTDMLAAMRCFLHILQHSTDRQGRPVIYVRIADIIKANMAEFVPLHTRLAMHSANCELNKLLCIMASARAGYHIEELTQVLDLSGLTPLQLLRQICSGVATPQIRLLNEYFPETVGKVIIINAPGGADRVWRVAQMFVPAATRQKVTICGSSYKQELLKYIEAHNLPDCYGGMVPFSWPPHQPPEELYQ